MRLVLPHTSYHHCAKGTQSCLSLAARLTTTVQREPSPVSLQLYALPPLCKGNPVLSLSSCTHYHHCAKGTQSCLSPAVRITTTVQREPNPAVLQLHVLSLGQRGGGVQLSLPPVDTRQSASRVLGPCCWCFVEISRCLLGLFQALIFFSINSQVDSVMLFIVSCPLSFCNVYRAQC